MDIEFLRYYKTLLECRSYTKAASECFISQSALSQAVRSLERELGFDLIDRSVPGVNVTESGEEFYRAAVASLEQIDRAIARCRVRESASIRTARVGVEPSYLGLSVISLVNEVAARLLDDVTLEITRAPRANLIELLQNGSIDLFFTVEPVDDPQLTCVKAVSCSVAACVAPESTYAEESSFHITDLIGMRLFTYNEQTSQGKLLKPWLTRNGISSIYVFEDSATLESMVLVDTWIVALDIVPATHAMPREGIRTIPVRESGGEFFLYAVQRKGFSPSNAASVLKSHVVLGNLGLANL